MFSLRHHLSTESRDSFRALCRNDILEPHLQHSQLNFQVWSLAPAANFLYGLLTPGVRS